MIIRSLHWPLDEIEVPGACIGHLLQQTFVEIVKDRLTPSQLRRYHLYLLEERRLAMETVVTQISALRFFCRHVLKRCDVREDLPYPKQRRRLPVVLSPEEVQRLIAGAKNISVFLPPTR